MERQDIINLLGITDTRLDMALYSGQLPQPIDNKWGDHAKIYIDHWFEVIESNKRKKSMVKTSPYPVHQR